MGEGQVLGLWPRRCAEDKVVFRLGQGDCAYGRKKACKLSKKCGTGAGEEVGRGEQDFLGCIRAGAGCIDLSRLEQNDLCFHRVRLTGESLSRQDLQGFLTMCMEELTVPAPF